MQDARLRRLCLVSTFAIIAATVTLVTSPTTAQDFDDVDLDSVFDDVDLDSVHAPAIAALDALDIFGRASTCSRDRFCPDVPIQRWVMAVWLTRAIGETNPTSNESRFSDVSSTAWWSPYAEALADFEITQGCASDPLSYCPNEPVTRAQMASFLTRAFDLEEASSAGFSDTEGNFHLSDINSLAAAEVTKGCSAEPLLYCPDDSVTRGQMATFLHRALLMRESESLTSLSDDVPDVLLTHIKSGDEVNLRSAVMGDSAVMLWFWAPW